MLQAYATVSILEKMGIEYELINYKKKITIRGAVKTVPRLLNRVLLNDKYEQFLKKRALKKYPEFAKKDNIRMEAFHAFAKEHFKRLSPIFFGYKELCGGAKRYSAVITGSDQLWSPAGLPTNYYNLVFVPEDIVKISYASSFGVAQIPWYQKNRTKKYLNRIEYISMRESRGTDIVKELTGKNVPTVLDPVFLFNKEGWEKLIPTEKVIDEPYIFAYFLGNNRDQKNVLVKVAKKLNLKIVTLRHLDQYIDEDEQFGDIAPYNIGPDKFLNIIRGAKYICTDSFHGTCFSIIHKKNFVVFNRYLDEAKHSKNSRIDSLCNNLGLNDRRFKDEERLIKQFSENIEYENVLLKYNELKKETDHYLNTIIERIKKLEKE